MLHVLAQPAQASSWDICELKVKVLEHHKSAGEIEVIILSVTSKPDVECPAKDARISFTPETADYQSNLPRKQWPKIGAIAGFRYQYLDGECKDRGPCRIEHYPVRK